MKVKMSEFLLDKRNVVKELIKLLSQDFKYVSVLGTDSFGKQYLVRRTGVLIQDSHWNERGFVVRVYNGTGYSEYSFNEIDSSNIGEIAAKIKKNVNGELENLKGKAELINYDIINEEKLEANFLGEAEISPEDCSDEEIVEKLTKIKDKVLASSDLIVEAIAFIQPVHVSKIFVSNNKDLYQSYVWSEGGVQAVAVKDDKNKLNYQGFSGLKGIELLEEMEVGAEKVPEVAVKLLDSKNAKPGEYDVICSPSVSGIIAHEAFGHGVEMDMFVKNRAKAVEYIDKPVASELVDMHDGATAAKHVSSYLFDDEGTIGKDTLIIDHGILKNGLSDVLSAIKLGTVPTGNGKRDSFERKSYARMTNTFFAVGKDKLEDMIDSIKSGYLLESPYSGMEDPKNWGIQCMVGYGYEIKDGKLTGNMVSPVVLTGYVPDLLKSISMVSDEVEIEGTGACGKGYSEWVKVSCGGPYIKAKVRIG